jgi:3-oxoacyl-[acyl-carrier protein] reductase
MSRFADQIALVTGASRGIGAATARALAAEGAQVAINYRSDEAGAVRTRDAIVDTGGVARIYRADIGRSEDVETLARSVEEDLGPVGVLVNNAALVERSSFLDAALDEFDRSWNANVRGVYQLSQLVANSMVSGNGGAIVHVSSILARLAITNRTAYIATKGAIEALTRAMALDLARHGIRVNAVAPGMIATEALLGGIPDAEVQKEMQRYVPEGRFGRPEEIAAAILFAASPEASYINGAVIGVDGAIGAAEAGPAH